MFLENKDIDPYDKNRLIKLAVHSKVLANFILQCYHEKVYHRDLIRVFIREFSERDPSLIAFANKHFPKKKTKKEVKNDEAMEVKERVYHHVFDHNDISSIYDILETDYPDLENDGDADDEEMC